MMQGVPSLPKLSCKIFSHFFENPPIYQSKHQASNTALKDRLGEEEKGRRMVTTHLLLSKASG